MPLRLAPVRVSWDRIIRATVGLRPHRPSGFVLRAEQVDGKTIIHNYGHGGAGMLRPWPRISRSLTAIAAPPCSGRASLA
jgi:hypothetical protein